MENIKIGSIVSTMKKQVFEYDTVTLAIDIMDEFKISSVVITDKCNKPVGIFTQHDALKVTSKIVSADTILADIMTKHPFFVYDSMDLHDAYMIMEKKGFRHIIVVNDDDEYMGIVTEGDFLRHFGFEDNSTLKDVSDAMSDIVLSIDDEMTLSQVSLLLSQNRSTFAVVIKNKKPIGIVNEHDIARNYKKCKYIKELHHIYSRETLFVVNNTSLQEATKKMSVHGVHQLLVIDQKENLLGSITRHDILKSINGRYFEFLIKKIEDKTNQERRLKHLLNYDQLTHLPNRNLFKELLDKSIKNTIENEQISAIILLDLDRFKEINDSYGHSIGDELLQAITNRLRKITKNSDVIARLGGDEFAIIIKDIKDPKNASVITDKIITHISSRYILSNSVNVHLSTTAGISIYPQDAQSSEELIQYADSALYRAKTELKGGYKYYSYEMTKESQQKIENENLLRDAIKNKRFELHYQPQIHIKTNKLTGCEALIRIKKEDGSYIPPNDFIPLAEESGMINQIGEWVIQEACRQGKIWLDAGHRITMAVNVSANQMRYQDLSSVIDASLIKSGFEASKLEIEITESAVMQREEEAVSKLHELRAKGVRLAIDDFGTGYSSLAYLKRFPIDVLKIDKSFIDDIPFEKDDMAITKAIIEMGKALGFQVLAEGVEEIEQLEFLQQNGCDYYQGYYKSKPLKAEEFTKLLEA